MSYTVSLRLKADTFQRFQHIHRQLNQAENSSLAKALGEVLADISCEIVDQVFGQMSRDLEDDLESEKVLEQIKDAVKKYMPWSVSFFSNERLVPIVNYLSDMTYTEDGKNLLCYEVDNVIIKETLGCLEQVRAGNNAYIQPAFKAFTHIVDQGVTSLVREPKKMLKFNFVVDKTLNGVITFTTQLGYRRLDKLANEFDAKMTDQYFRHFFAFMQPTELQKES